MRFKKADRQTNRPNQPRKTHHNKERAIKDNRQAQVEDNQGTDRHNKDKQDKTRQKGQNTTVEGKRLEATQHNKAHREENR